MTATRCLVVDDDSEILESVRAYLSGFGMSCAAARSGREMRAALAEHAFDVVILDLMLPDENGIDLCKWLRTSSQLPVIMLTAQGDPITRVLGLEIGADDFVGKPFDPRELVARIHAVLRRTRPAGGRPSHRADVEQFHGWSFDRVRRLLVSPQEVAVPLSGAECRLLCAFLDHPRRVLSRRELLDMTRVSDVNINERGIDLAVSRLRQKLGAQPGNSFSIATIRGEGYMLDIR